MRLALLIPLFFAGCAFGQQVLMNEGKDAAPNSHPWLMALIFKGITSSELRCGASLIPVPYLTDSSDLVLTAAHCAASYSMGTLPRCPKPDLYKNFEISAGKHKISTLQSYQDIEEGEIRVKVISGSCHPQWRRDNFTHDITILKLATPIKFTDKMKAIELAKKGDRLAPGTQCKVAGFGATSLNDDGTTYDRMPKVLQEVDVKIQDDARCGQDKYYDAANKYCEVGLDGKGHACLGDSGGPLVCQKDGKNVQYGILSGGSEAKGSREDCTNVLEVVHTDVAAYADWIDEQIKVLGPKA